MVLTTRQASILCRSHHWKNQLAYCASMARDRMSHSHSVVQRKGTRLGHNCTRRFRLVSRSLPVRVLRQITKTMFKNSKYDAITSTHIVVPIAVNTAGSWNTQAIKCIQELESWIAVVTKRTSRSCSIFVSETRWPPSRIMRPALSPSTLWGFSRLTSHAISIAKQ